MLYLLFELFNINIFQYITLRAGIAFVTSFLLVVYILPKFIDWLKLKEASQPIYDLAPNSHQTKSTIPTMGGTIFVGVSITVSLFTMRLDNLFAIGAILTLMLFMAIGIKDDYHKLKGKSNQAGLTSKKKFTLQAFSSIIICMFLYLNGFTT
jgi:phospho-N-acetylmuramoyl-pentapeptide-transferase